MVTKKILGAVNVVCAVLAWHSITVMAAEPVIAEQAGEKPVAMGISYSSRLPIAGKPVRIKANALAAEDRPCRWVIQPVESVKDAVEIASAADAENAEISWTPSKTGFYRIALRNADGRTLCTDTVPVVWREIHLLSWQNPEDCRYVGTSVFLNPATISDHAYWRGRGSKVLSGVWVRPGDLFGKTDEEVVGFFVDRAKQASAAGVDGIYVDELGVYPDGNGLVFMAQCSKAFAKVRELYPKLRVHTWIGGPIQREEIAAARDNGHIFMLEAYPEFSATYFGGHSFKSKLESWVSNIRNQDSLLNQETGCATIVTLGISGNCGNTDTALIEERLRMVRRIAPESPGICFYYGNLRGTRETPRPTTFEKLLDDLSLTYYIRPVLTFFDEDMFWAPRVLETGKAVTVKVLVRNIGGMAVRNVRVRLGFRDMTGSFTTVGEAMLSEIGNGMVNEPFDGNFYPTPFKVVNGSKRMVAGPRNGKVHVFLDRALAEFTWTPTKAAHGEFVAEIVPETGITLLDGLLTREVVVR